MRLSQALCLCLLFGLQLGTARQQPRRLRKPSRILAASTSLEDVRGQVPSTGDLLRFGLPTLGVWFLQPVLSLIDSSVIGKSRSPQSALELAALGPGIAWIDSTAYSFQFLGMATTILLNRGLIRSNDDEVAKSLSHSVITSFGCGLLLGVFQYALSLPAMRFLSGKSTELVHLAALYSKIRSFGALFAVPTIVIQSAFLALKDAVTPLEAVLFGGLFNLIGDILLVSVFHQGIAGAAYATFLSQFFGFLYLAYVGLRRIKKSEKFRWQNMRQFLSLVRFPTLKESLSFFSYAGPLFVVIMIKSILWTYTTFAASKSGAFNLAAHQITINFFLLFCIFGDVVSQMSQSFSPPFLKFHLANTDIDPNQSPLYILLRKIFSIAAVVGSVNTVISYVLSQFTPQVTEPLTEYNPPSFKFSTLPTPRKLCSPSRRSPCFSCFAFFRIV